MTSVKRRSPIHRDPMWDRAGKFPLAEAPNEPVAREPCHLFQRTGLFEQVRRAGHDFDAMLGSQSRGRFPLRTGSAYQFRSQ